MKADDLKPGVRVRVTTLGSTQGVLGDPAYLANRQEGVLGHILRPLKSHPHFWWVRHLDGKHAPYSFMELEAAPDEWKGSLFE